MKIQVISDLHLEHYDYDVACEYISAFDPSGVDVLVIAGDLASHAHIEDYIELFCKKYTNVVFVAGNHEYYGTDISIEHDLFNLMRRIKNFYYLENSSCVIGGQRFLGCTLWFPWGPLVDVYKKYTNDDVKIKDFRNFVLGRNAKSTMFLDDINNDDIVVTHYVPTYAGVSEQYRSQPETRLFACELGNLIADKQPKLWVYGHTHNPHDFTIGKTRLVCNPRGYSFEHNAFNKNVLCV